MKRLNAGGRASARPLRVSPEIFAPVLFVLLWSTGFIVARYATRDAGALTFLFLRMIAAAVILWLFAVVTDAPKLSRSDVQWAGIAGLGLHSVYLGGVFLAASWGLPSGLSALIAGLHPVATSLGARFILRERLSNAQWIGVALGVGGVVAVVIDRLEAGVNGITAGALVAMILSVLGMASGTLVQRAKGSTMPLLRGTAVQYASAAVVLGVGSVVHEGFDVEPTARFWWSLVWAVGVLSIAAVLIMLWLLQRRATVRVSSLFFLTPALSTVEGAILFDERLGVLALAGLGFALVGVYLTTRA